MGRGEGGGGGGGRDCTLTQAIQIHIDGAVSTSQVSRHRVPEIRTSINSGISNEGITILCSEVSLDVPRSGFHEWCGVSVGWQVNDFISDVEGEDVVVWEKGVDGCDVSVEEVGGPRR